MKGKRSGVVLDPKGEPCAIRKSRRRVSDVMILNPYRLLAENPAMPLQGEAFDRATRWLFNPLAALDSEEGKDQ